MNFWFLVLAVFVGCLIENIMLGVIQYILKQIMLKKVGDNYKKTYNIK